MTNLSKSDLGSNWLKSQFTADEQPTAAALIDELLLISSSMFARGITEKIIKILEDQPDQSRPIGLYAERQVDSEKSISGIRTIQPFWPETETGRATGLGTPPIVVDPAKQDVGSEGSIANVITNLARLKKGRILSHPGPDELRGKRAGAIVILTDLIGSGQRIFEMLEAFGAVASLRSWRSYRKIRYYVVSYASTELGLRTIKKSRLKPEIRVVVGCPTVEQVFSGTALQAIMALCNKYPGGSKTPLGHRNTGALIAFEHGAPNNAPRMLHSSTRGWTPLFTGRSTSAAGSAFPSTDLENIARRMSAIFKIQEARRYLDDVRTQRWIQTMVVLKAISAGYNSPQGISSYSGLPITNVNLLLSRGVDAHWIAAGNALTSLGRLELIRLKKRRRRNPVLPLPWRPFYYPTQLRAR